MLLNPLNNILPLKAAASTMLHQMLFPVLLELEYKHKERNCNCYVPVVKVSFNGNSYHKQGWNELKFDGFCPDEYHGNGLNVGKNDEKSCKQKSRQTQWGYKPHDEELNTVLIKHVFAQWGLSEAFAGRHAPSGASARATH